MSDERKLHLIWPLVEGRHVPRLADEHGELPGQLSLNIDQTADRPVLVTATFQRVEMAHMPQIVKREEEDRDPNCTCGTSRVCDIHFPER